MFVVGSVVAFGRFEVPLVVFFTADPFLLDAHIDVCTRASDPTVSSIQEVSLLNCRSPLRFDRLVDFRLVLFDVWNSYFHRNNMNTFHVECITGFFLDVCCKSDMLN